jgi:predicted nucleic acid-binding protein
MLSSASTGAWPTRIGLGPINDMWVAACCIAFGVPLATFNLKDFEDLARHDGLAFAGP